MDPEIKKITDEMGKAWVDFTATQKTLIEECKGKDAILEEHIKKATEAIAKNHEDLTAKYTEIATKLNRVPTEGTNNQTDDEKQFAKDAVEFTRLRMLKAGTYRIGTSIDPAVALTEYKGYSDALPKFLRKGENGDFQKDLSIGSDLDGGFFVRPVWSNRIITRIFETSPVRQFATVETASGPEIKYPVDTDQPDCGWTGETQARPATQTPVVQEKAIVAQELYALPKATQSILEDAGVDIEAWLMNKLADKFARTENTAFIVGSGVAQPRGILTYPDGVNWAQLQQVGTGVSGHFSVSGLTNTVGSLKENYHPNARWFIQRASVPDIMLLQDGAGRYIFQPIFTVGYNAQPLLGYPISYAADVPGLGAGALAAIFGDFKVGYTIVDRLGISLLRDPYLYKPFIGFYTRKRTGGDVLNFEALKIVVLT